MLARKRDFYRCSLVYSWIISYMAEIHAQGTNKIASEIFLARKAIIQELIVKVRMLPNCIAEFAVFILRTTQNNI